MRRLLTVTFVCLLLTVETSLSAAAATRLLRIAPNGINFGTQPVGMEVLRGATITNTSGSDVLLLVEGGLPDDFGFGSASPRRSSSPGSGRPERSPRPCGTPPPENCSRPSRSRSRDEVRPSRLPVPARPALCAASRRQEQ